MQGMAKGKDDLLVFEGLANNALYLCIVVDIQINTRDLKQLFDPLLTDILVQDHIWVADHRQEARRHLRQSCYTEGHIRQVLY